jgi:HD superfamily phosphohydrolase YqeK
MARVASLLSSWANALGLSEEDRRRWASIGYLHDAVREGDIEVLRARVPPTLADLPDRVLHGPAAASMLRDEGVQDEEILGAVAWHTLGHAELGVMGRALYAADFLEPGRNLLNEWRGRLRERLPEELDAVVRDMLAARIAHVVEGGGALRPETVGFWNALAVRP